MNLNIFDDDFIPPDLHTRFEGLSDKAQELVMAYISKHMLDCIAAYAKDKSPNSVDDAKLKELVITVVEEGFERAVYSPSGLTLL